MVSSSHSGVRTVDLRLELPLATRQLFTEVRASVSRRCGEDVDRAEALRVVLEVFRSLPEEQASRLVSTIRGRFSTGRFQ